MEHSVIHLSIWTPTTLLNKCHSTNKTFISTFNLWYSEQVKTYTERFNVMYVQSGSLFLLSVLSKALYLSFHLLFSGGSGKTFSHDNDTGMKHTIMTQGRKILQPSSLHWNSFPLVRIPRKRVLHSLLRSSDSRREA